MFLREYAQADIAFWWRRVREKHLKRTVLMEMIRARKAATTVQARRPGWDPQRLEDSQ